MTGLSEPRLFSKESPWSIVEIVFHSGKGTEEENKSSLMLTGRTTRSTSICLAVSTRTARARES